MTELTNILVPIALSPSCAWAAEYSARFANRFNSKLLFLHAGNCPRETVETFWAKLSKTLRMKSRSARAIRPMPSFNLRAKHRLHSS